MLLKKKSNFSLLLFGCNFDKLNLLLLPCSIIFRISDVWTEKQYQPAHNAASFFNSGMYNTLNYLTLEKFYTVFKISNYTKKIGACYYILETLLHVAVCLNFPNSIWLQRSVCKTFNFQERMNPFPSDSTRNITTTHHCIASITSTVSSCTDPIQIISPAY